MKWIPVTEQVPVYGASVLAWRMWREEDEEGFGEIEIATFRESRLIHPEDPDERSYITRDPHFHWAGGDNDRAWPESANWHGQGGYGAEDGADRVTHWMPLPEAP
jgi:hypothetical protein